MRTDKRELILDGIRSDMENCLHVKFTWESINLLRDICADQGIELVVREHNANILGAPPIERFREAVRNAHTVQGLPFVEGQNWIDGIESLTLKYAQLK